MVKPEIFETAFLEGTKARSDEVEIDFFPFNIGDINIESGKIIACDPSYLKDSKPFVQSFPVGKYPVQLAVARIYDDQRVAFSRILFSTNPVAKWEFALHEGQKPMSIFKESIYGYPVDGGMGIFIDEKANSDLMLMMDKDESMWEDIFVKRGMETYRHTWSHLLYDFEGHNLANFSTGYGDGLYATYIGYDNNGLVCSLLTDFALVDWWKKWYSFLKKLPFFKK